MFPCSLKYSFTSSSSTEERTDDLPGTDLQVHLLLPFPGYGRRRGYCGAGIPGTVFHTALEPADHVTVFQFAGNHLGQGRRSFRSRCNLPP